MEEIRNSRGTLSSNAASSQPRVSPVKDTRTSLMDEIRNARGGFNTLRHVSDEKKARPSILENPRDQLLDQIRSGVTLKKVDLDSLSSGGHGGGGGSDNSSSAEPTGMAGMLQRALQERTTALNFSSSDNEEDEDEYDDEWD